MAAASCRPESVRRAAIDGSCVVPLRLVLHGLHQGLDFVRIVGDPRFDRLGGLVLGNEVLNRLGDGVGHGRGLVGHHGLRHSGRDIGAPDRGDVADPGLVHIVQQAERCGAPNIGAFEGGQDDARGTDPERVLGHRLRLRDAEQRPAGPP